MPKSLVPWLNDSNASGITAPKFLYRYNGWNDILSLRFFSTLVGEEGPSPPQRRWVKIPGVKDSRFRVLSLAELSKDGLPYFC
jgi:hypothetical protein